MRAIPAVPPLAWLPLAWLLPLAACVPPDDDGGRTNYGDDTGGDTGGDTDDPDPVVGTPELDVTRSTDVPTVFRVTWPADFEGDVSIEFGLDTSYGRVATPAAGAHQVDLVGLPPDSAVHLRAVVAGEDGPVEGVDLERETGSRPANVPTVSLEAEAGDGAWGAFLLVPVGDEDTKEQALLLLDRQGETVWWKLTGMFPPSVTVSARDGSVLYRIDGQFDDKPNGAVYRVGWFDTDEELLVASDDGHHDFLELPDGTLALIEQDIREWGGEAVVGDRITEYAPNGSSRVAWNAWDTMTPEPDEDWGIDANPLGVDWTHANGLDYDPTTGQYLVSLFYEEALLAIPRSTGEIAWRFGRTHSDYALAGDPGFGPQHGPNFVDGGVLVFDNHSDGAGGIAASRVARYALSDGTATLAWEYTPHEGRLSGVLGDSRLLADGSVYVSTGIGGEMQVVSAAGELQWAVAMTPGSMIGRGVVLGGDLLRR